MSNQRKTLIEKIQKVQDISKGNNEDKITLNLTPLELNLVKLGVKALDAFESIIEDEVFNK